MSDKPTIAAVVFDLDDTLYPERAYAFSGFDAVAAAFEDLLGDPDQAVADMRLIFERGDRRRVFNTLLADRGSKDDEPLIRRMIETYRTHQPTISLAPDAAAALKRLRTRRYPLGLITDGPAVMQAAKVQALALEPRFDAIILTEELGPEFGKPHPRAFELMAERLHVAPQQCAYVADNVAKDFLAPNALGWLTVQITRGDGVYRNAQPARGGEPNHVIETLDSLDDLLSQPG